MIIFTILIAVVFLLGALVLWAIYLHAELKGYERGLDEAEEIMREVQNERQTNMRRVQVSHYCG